MERKKEEKKKRQTLEEKRRPSGRKSSPGVGACLNHLRGRPRRRRSSDHASAPAGRGSPGRWRRFHRCTAAALHAPPGDVRVSSRLECPDRAAGRHPRAAPAAARRCRAPEASALTPRRVRVRRSGRARRVDEQRIGFISASRFARSGRGGRRQGTVQDTTSDIASSASRSTRPPRARRPGGWRPRPDAERFRAFRRRPAEFSHPTMRSPADSSRMGWASTVRSSLRTHDPSLARTVYSSGLREAENHRQTCCITA